MSTATSAPATSSAPSAPASTGASAAPSAPATPAASPFDGRSWFSSQNLPQIADPDAPVLPKGTDAMTAADVMKAMTEHNAAMERYNKALASNRENRQFRQEIENLFGDGVELIKGDKDSHFKVSSRESADRALNFLRKGAYSPRESFILANFDDILNHAMELGARRASSKSAAPGAAQPSPGKPDQKVVVPNPGQGRKSQSTDIKQILAEEFGLNPRALAADPSLLYEDAGK